MFTDLRVVGDQYHRPTKLHQPGLKDIERVNIEIVGRLIEQEDIGGLPHQVGDKNTRLLPARELVYRCLQLIWPEKKPHPIVDPDRDPPSSLEKAYARLYEEIVASADYFIDFHNAWIGSLSFALRDRILYQEDDAADRQRAHELAERLDQMVNAYGHSVVNEYPADTYIRENLHRTASGSVLQKSRIPAFTAELGTGLVPDPVILRAACAGTRNVMRWAGMLDDEPEAIEDIRVIRPGYPVCRMRTPRVQEACIVHHLVDAGMRVGKGDVVAEMRDVWGRPVGNGVIRSSHEGIVLGRTHGVYFYPGQPILTMAVRDSGSLTAPYPETVSQPAAT